MAKTEEVKKLNILDVAQQLGMSFKRVGHGSYAWEEHDSFIISTSKNIYSWFSKDKHGDVIDLVRTVKEYQTGQPVSFKEAKRYLETGEFEQANIIEQPRPTFSYYLEQYENQDMTKARDYLRQERGLSDETIDHFIDQGLLAQATKKTGSIYEPVIVFKTLNKAGEVTGASLQGIVENRELHDRGRLKQLMRASDGLSGMTLDIGQPKRLVFAESPIDLMSYYQLHKDQLADVRLVAMDGLKEGTISRHFAELWAEREGTTYTVDRRDTPKLLEKTAKVTTILRDEANKNLITLAIDNDEAGRRFVAKLQDKGIPVVPALPPLKEGQEKMDWNDYLKQKGQDMEQDNSRLAQAKRKLERLENDLVEATEAVFAHQAQTNGQPMNDKRGASSFFRRRDQLEEKAISLTREIEAQKERIEKLEWQEENRAAGLNRSGSGLAMTVSNIPRIKEEIEKFHQGESFYTRETIRRYEKKLVELEAMAKTVDETALSPGVQHLIDEGLVNQWQKQPTTYFIKDLRKVAFVLQEDGSFELSPKYRPNTDQEKSKVDELLNLIETKNSEAYLEEPSEQIEQKKSQEQAQGIDNVGGELLNRNSSYLGVDTPRTAPQPVVDEPQPNFPTNIHLHFTTDEGDMSNKDFRKNMRTLNLYANAMRDSAMWYLSEMAGTTMSYVYKMPEEDALQILNVRFDKRNWMHLTGVTPVYDRWVDSLSEQFVEDIVAGKGHYKELKFSAGTVDKLKVLSLLPEIIESDTFVFNDLSSVQKFNNLDLSKALNPEDTDLLLLFKEEGLHQVPASLMRIKGRMEGQLSNIDNGTVLGVYREREGKLEQLSINEDYIKDGGAEMMAIMENHLFEKEQTQEEVLQEESQIGNLELESPRDRMTRVLDTTRELGRSIFTPEKEKEFSAELAEIDQLLDKYEGDLDLVITDLTLRGLVDTESDFYRNWVDDMVYEHQGVGWTDALNGKISQEDFSNFVTKTLTALEDKVVNQDKEGPVESSPERSSVEPLETEEVSEASPQKVKELIANKDTRGLSDYMKAGIKTYLNSDQYKEFLTALSHLPNYSANNLMLLKAQKPNVQAVASFKVWKEKFGRMVNKGEQALRIWAPVIITKKDKETGQPILDDKGKPETYTTFKLVPVFDVSQTNGKDLPKAVNQLEGRYEDYAKLYRATKQLANENGVAVEVSAINSPYNGYYVPDTSKIVIKQGMSETQTLKTFFHELAHSYLHNKEAMANKSYSRSEKELQAESVAFVMASHYGIDTSSYSFGYLANWSRDKEALSDFEAQLNIVQKSAQELIQRLDNILEMQQEKTRPMTKLDEKIAQAKTKSVTKPKEQAVIDQPKKLESQAEHKIL